MARLKTAGAIAIAVGMLALAACGSDDGSDGSGGGKSLSDTTISYVGFGGVFDEQLKKVWMDPFTKETGAKFVLDSPTDYSKVQLQVESGNVSYDIVDGDQFFINPQCGKLFDPIEDVDQSAVLPQFKVDSECGVADYVYGLGMYFDKAKYPNGGPQNCIDFFDTKKFPGKRAIWSYVAAAGALECAAIADGADPLNPYPIDLDKAIAKLETIKSDLTTFDSGSQAVDNMVNGDAPIVLATTLRYLDATAKGANYGLASEYAGRGAGAFAIPKGAPNKAAAIAWLQSIMAVDRNREIAAAAPSISSVTGGETPESWPQAAKDADVVSGPLSKVAWTVDQLWWADNYDKAAEEYAALFAG